MTVRIRYSAIANRRRNRGLRIKKMLGNAARPGERRVALRQVQRALQVISEAALAPARQVAHVGLPVVAAMGAQKVIDGVKSVSGKKRSATSKKSSMAKRKKTSSNATKSYARSSSKSTVYKRKRKSTKKRKTIKQRIARVEKVLPRRAVHDVREIVGGYVRHGNQRCYYETAGMFDAAFIESKLNNLAFIDRGVTPAIDSIDLTAAGLGQVNLSLENLYSKLVVRNNNKVDAVVDIYALRCKENTNLSPVAAMQANDQDYSVVGGTLDSTDNILTYPSDFEYFRRHWQIVSHSKTHLRPGDEHTAYFSQKYMKYNPQMLDIDDDQYQTGNTVWFIRTMGSVGYNSTTEEEVTTCDGTVHYVKVRKMLIKYDSDAPFHKIETENNLTDISAPAQGGPQTEVDATDVHD